jgi:hypothetical protein
VIEPIAKVLIGTAFYVGILWAAQHNPRAAGMMLTFPTLNGLVLLMAAPSAIEDAASAMLLMPLINAAMWAFYLAGFDRLVDRRVTPAVASALLIGAGATGWLVLAVAITRWQWGVPAAWQGGYVLAVLGAGGVMTLALSPTQPRPGAGSPAKPQTLATLIGRYRERIAIFALTLAAIAAMNGLGASPALLGAMAGAPLVAMFGMQTIAGDGAAPLSARRASFAMMAEGLWLGPVIAIAFVAGLWRALAVLSATVSGLTYHLCGITLLLAGWGLCLFAIWSLSLLMQRTSPKFPAERIP